MVVMKERFAVMVAVRKKRCRKEESRNRMRRGWTRITR